MPLYDYQCRTCGNFRELRRMMEAGAPQPCPACGALAERLLSAPFLGGGEPNRGDQGRVPWRATCGHGCTHAFHR